MQITISEEVEDKYRRANRLLEKVWRTRSKHGSLLHNYGRGLGPKLWDLTKSYNLFGSDSLPYLAVNHTIWTFLKTENNDKQKYYIIQILYRGWNGRSICEFHLFWGSTKYTRPIGQRWFGYQLVRMVERESMKQKNHISVNLRLDWLDISPSFQLDL